MTTTQQHAGTDSRALTARPTSPYCCCCARASHLVLVEPSAEPADPAALADIPVTLITGDHLDINDLWRTRAAAWATFAADLRAAGATAHHPALAPGHSHLPMHDLGHDTVLDAILATLPG